MSLTGFIGLGNMGAHMARNLIKNGHKLIVYDVVQKATAELKAEGASVAGSPAEIASASTHIVTMLPSTPHVLEVYQSKTGIFQTIQAGTLCMDSSTIDPAASRNVAALAKDKNAFYMDAPVSGGVLAAKDAGLTFMVGGAKEGFDRAEKVLSLMGKKVVHCGDSGTGQAAKICNNMLLAISMIGTSEAMNLGQRLGLDGEMLASIINSATGQCWSSALYNPVPGILPNVPSSKGYAGGFGTTLMTKDLGLAQIAATDTKTPTPLGSLAHQIYRLLSQNPEFAPKDFSVVYQFLKENKDKL